jgi:GTP-binding protein HSR1-related protein
MEEFIMKKESIYEAMQNDIMNANISENDKNKMLKNVMRLKNQKMNIMITGATGCGKSSTINAMFNTEVAKVGVGVDPETMEIRKYELDNLVLWDTPGLGDGKEADNRHAKNIIDKLLEVDENGNALIDLVLVILDGGSRDLGTSYQLINNVIIPNLGKGKENRILVAINQADTAMKGHNWDYDKNEPNQKLVNFLEKKVRSVRDRVYEATHVTIEPIYYSAGYKDEEGEQSRPYNLSKLLYYIVKATPSEKRAIYVNNINENREMWRDDDKLLDYGEATRKSIFESIREGASAGAGIGGAIGGAIDGILGSEGESIFRGVGEAIGGIIGGIIGFFF